MEFSNEVIKELNYYVYRLINPINGHTFYVGKGQGNRIFQHANGNIGYYDGVVDSSENDPNKLKIIREIKESGLDVIYVIHRWGLTEKEAYLVEATLIDCYQGLSNLQNGHYSNDFGVTNAKTLIDRFSCKIYDEPSDFKYIIIKVKNQRIDYMIENDVNDPRYEATRYCWRINPQKAQKYPYVFSVTNGIVKEVYKVDEWKKVQDRGRYEFFGKIATEEIREKFVNKRIPDVYAKKGMASPVLFSKN